MSAVPRGGHEAGFHRIHYDFHGSGVNYIYSCLVQYPRFPLPLVYAVPHARPEKAMRSSSSLYRRAGKEETGTAPFFIGAEPGIS